MTYLTDYEKRILFSALAREKKVCETMDRLEPPKGTPLVKIVESLKSKFYYDRYEKEIRAKAIDEFTEKVCQNGAIADFMKEYIKEIAEQMKGEQHG